MRLQILVATMHQTDFSKIEQMNIHSDVIFANQSDKTTVEERRFDGHTAKMITTSTKGVGINRNIALLYADADICLLADDDVIYDEGLENKILGEFEKHRDADVMIFNLDSGTNIRKQRVNPKTKKCGPLARMPYGGCRIAFRLSSVRKANVWFTTLFGGGCLFPSGEDSMWLNDLRKKGLTFYVSKEMIGKVTFGESSWFTGRDEKYFFGRGAYYEAVHPRTAFLWMVYFAFRARENCEMRFKEKMNWMKRGRQGYTEMEPFEAVRDTV